MVSASRGGVGCCLQVPSGLRLAQANLQPLWPVALRCRFQRRTDKTCLSRFLTLRFGPVNRNYFHQIVPSVASRPGSRIFRITRPSAVGLYGFRR